MADITALETLLDDAIVERVRVVQERNQKRRLMLEEATAKIDAAIAAEFDSSIAMYQNVENMHRTALENARLEIGRKRFAASNYKGLLVEWGRHSSNWYDTEKRDLLYPTGRRGLLQVCERETRFADNITHYKLPKIGDLFIRLVKKDGTSGLQHVLLYGGEVGGHWLPAGEKPEKAG